MKFSIWWPTYGNHHRGVAIFTFSFIFPYPVPPSRVLSLVNADGYSSKWDVTLHRASLGECIRPNYNDVMHIGSKYWETLLKEILFTTGYMLYICVACMCSACAVSWAHRSVDGSMGATKNIIIVKWVECVMTCVMYCKMSCCIVMLYNPLWWNASTECMWY